MWGAAWPAPSTLQHTNSLLPPASKADYDHYDYSLDSSSSTSNDKASTRPLLLLIFANAQRISRLPGPPLVYATGAHSTGLSLCAEITIAMIWLTKSISSAWCSADFCQAS